MCSEQLPWTAYEGWEIRANRQCRIRPYLDFVAYARRETRGVVVMFNVEGRTLAEAIERVQAAVRDRNRLGNA